MSEKLKPGDFVWIRGVDHKPLQYMVVRPAAEGMPSEIGGMTLVGRWYRNDMLIKIEEDEDGRC